MRENEFNWGLEIKGSSSSFGEINKRAEEI